LREAKAGSVAAATWSSVLELAAEGRGDDAAGYRTEFVGLVEKAKALDR